MVAGSGKYNSIYLSIVNGIKSWEQVNVINLNKIIFLVNLTCKSLKLRINTRKKEIKGCRNFRNAFY